MITTLIEQRGWVYICIDSREPNECKVGMTTRPLAERICETTNPYYLLVKAYKVPADEAYSLEQHLHKELDKHFRRNYHLMSRGKAEWFFCSAEKAIEVIEHPLAKCLRMQSEYGEPNLSSIVYRPPVTVLYPLWSIIDPNLYSYYENLLSNV